jgi:hypothetical protein
MAGLVLWSVLGVWAQQPGIQAQQPARGRAGGPAGPPLDPAAVDRGRLFFAQLLIGIKLDHLSTRFGCLLDGLEKAKALKPARIWLIVAFEGVGLATDGKAALHPRFTESRLAVLRLLASNRRTRTRRSRSRSKRTGLQVTVDGPRDRSH